MAPARPPIHLCRNGQHKQDSHGWILFSSSPLFLRKCHLFFFFFFLFFRFSGSSLALASSLLASFDLKFIQFSAMCVVQWLEEARPGHCILRFGEKIYDCMRMRGIYCGVIWLLHTHIHRNCLCNIVIFAICCVVALLFLFYYYYFRLVHLFCTLFSFGLVWLWTMHCGFAGHVGDIVLFTNLRVLVLYLLHWAVAFNMVK